MVHSVLRSHSYTFSLLAEKAAQVMFKADTAVHVGLRIPVRVIPDLVSVLESL